MKATDKEQLLANGPIVSTMLKLGIPTFVAQLIFLLYNVVDRIYIGHIPGQGSAALTGLGICFPIISLVTAFASFVGAGGSPLAGIALGKGFTFYYGDSSCYGRFNGMDEIYGNYAIEQNDFQRKHYF